MKTKNVAPAALALVTALALFLSTAPADAIVYQETPMLKAKVAAGTLPPIAKRLPADPDIVTMNGKTRTYGKEGGTLRMLIANDRDVRFLSVYGYARLVAYNESFKIVPAILKSYNVKDGRIFTFHLRPGMKWSDGQPFTSADFRYWWDDVANNPALSPNGPPERLLVDGEKPRVTFPGLYTVRYAWAKPNPYFLPALAAAAPLYIYAPAHYLRHFNIKTAKPAELRAMMDKYHMHNWAELENYLDHPYSDNNPDLPTLDPWVVTNRMPAQEMVAVRNPYYYRVDAEGHQLPYIDRVVMAVASPQLIAAKTAAGQSDLQARGLDFSNFTFLKRSEQHGGYHVYLWRTAKGSYFTLYPNLNVDDPTLQKLFRAADFRRALSLAINRHAINQTLFFGLAIEGNNTVLPGSPLYRPQYRTKWATYDPAKANALLDKLGLGNHDGNGIRLMPNGQPLNIVVASAGIDPNEVDILQLIRTDWRKIGVRLLIKPLSRKIMREQMFTGRADMAVWTGLEDGVATPESIPDQLAPMAQMDLEWPKWGQFFETGGRAGEKIDLPAAQKLFDLDRRWAATASSAERAEIWHQMLAINANQQFTIGVVSAVPQPVVVNDHLHNVPAKGIYNWNPGAMFGIYRPDTFWFDATRRHAADP